MGDDDLTDLGVPILALVMIGLSLVTLFIIVIIT